MLWWKENLAFKWCVAWLRFRHIIGCSWVFLCCDVASTTGVIAGGFNPWSFWPWKNSRTTEDARRYNFKWRHFFLFWACELGITKCFKYWVVYLTFLLEQPADLWSYLRSWWLGNVMSKRAPKRMRLSEVVANTTRESLQRVGADCCVPIGLVSTLICNYALGHESCILWWKENLTFKWCVASLRHIKGCSWGFLCCEY